MKHLIILLFIAAYSATSYAQESSMSDIKYKGGSMYLVTQDAKGNETNRLPFGTSVYVFVNPFFHTYSIGFTDNDGQVHVDIYKFVKDIGKGTYKMYYNNGKGTITYEYLSDNLASSQSLNILTSSSTKYEKVLLVINGLTKY